VALEERRWRSAVREALSQHLQTPIKRIRGETREACIWHTFQSEGYQLIKQPFRSPTSHGSPRNWSEGQEKVGVGREAEGVRCGERAEGVKLVPEGTHAVVGGEAPVRPVAAEDFALRHQDS
jgi:hypothetical protein